MIQEWCNYTNIGVLYYNAIIDISLLINDMIINFLVHLLVKFWWLIIRNVFSLLEAYLQVVFAIFILFLLNGWKDGLVIILCSFARLGFFWGSCRQSSLDRHCLLLVLGDLCLRCIAWRDGASCEGMVVLLRRVILQPFPRTKYRLSHRRPISLSIQEPSRQVYLLMISYLKSISSVV